MIRTFVSSLLALAVVTVPPPRPHVQPVLTGTVSNSSGQPVQGAAITVRDLVAQVITGADGKYRTPLPDSLRGRNLVISARALGYQPQSTTIRVAGDSVVANFTLATSPLTLDQVVVTGAAAVQERRVLGATVATVGGNEAKRPRTPVQLQGEPDYGTEVYGRISENTFRSARQVPLSTFSIDVDRASYANVRRFINSGQLPPADAIRLEELVNYFPYDYAAPTSDDPVHFNADVARAPWAPNNRLVRIGVQARRVPLEKLPPSNLVFLLDVSGSMSSANKLPLVNEAFRMLVDQLRENDRVAIVVYAGAAGLVLPSTPGSSKAEIRAALDRLEAGGSTAGGAGIHLAYRVATEHFIEGGNNRVILATDGDFNVGASSDAEMEALIEAKRAGGTFLTVLGFGMGNLKDSKLEKLADRGNGNYAYVDSPLEARKVFVHEFGGTMLTVAKDVKLQVEFNPARVKSYRLLGYENRLLNDQDFTDDRKDAGDMGAGHSVTALYEIVPTDRYAEPKNTSIPLRYQDERPLPRASGTTGELLQIKMRFKERDGSKSREVHTIVEDRLSPLRGEFAFATAVAEYAMVLRGSKHAGSASLASALARAEGSLGEDVHGYRRDFLGLVRQTIELRERVASIDRR